MVLYPEKLTMENIALGFDLDGTITKLEILPQIAREIDLFDELSLLTEATMNGTLPFEKSFRLRCRILKDIPISRVQDIVNSIPLENDIVKFIQKHHNNCFVITGNLDVWVSPLIKKIGCNFFVSNAKYRDDTLLGIDTVLNKADAIRSLKRNFLQVTVIGEGMNDVPMFEAADIKIAYGGVHSPSFTIIQLANYVTMNSDGLCRLLSTLL